MLNSIAYKPNVPSIDLIVTPVIDPSPHNATFGFTLVTQDGRFHIRVSGNGIAFGAFEGVIHTITVSDSPFGGVARFYNIGSGQPLKLADFLEVSSGASPVYRFRETALLEMANSHSATLLDDQIALLGGDDIGFGHAGDDVIRGGLGGDTLYGGTGDDTLFGESGDDIVDGGAGDDLVIVDDATPASGQDVAIGGEGTDRLVIALGGPVGATPRYSDFSAWGMQGTPP